MPRYMIIRMADRKTEAGALPTHDLLAKMGAYMEEMHKAGILRGGDGLRPSSEGKRVKITPTGKPKVIDGPFTEAKELVAGYALIEVGSDAEALEWVRRWPREDAVDGEVTLELRRFVEEDDFGAEFTPELRAHEARMRREIEGR